MKILMFALLLYGCGQPIKESKTKNKISNNLLSGVSENILLDTSMSLNFDLLPLKGEVKKSSKFWSGDSWRLSRGAINLRWNSKNREGFNYISPSRREALTYPVEKMKELSPSEKYDLYMGRYDYPLRWEVDFFARNGSEDWEGICHGWAGATMNHEDPLPLTAINPDGVEIYFGSSDIKALISYAYSKVLIRDVESLGRRCEGANFVESEDRCDDDLSPVSLHAVLTNIIGLRGRSVIADMDRYKEVWNHPILKYETVVEKMMGTSYGREATLRTKIIYLDVVEKNSWNTHPAVTSQMTVKYKLELDTHGNILNGKWLSRERPDFLWTVQKQESFDGYLNGVMNLIK